MNNIELIITVRCKKCGDIISVITEIDSDSEKKEAKDAIDQFTKDHQHSPWVV